MNARNSTAARSDTTAGGWAPRLAQEARLGELDAQIAQSGGDSIIRKGLGRTKYEAITLERGLTEDQDFVNWANSSQVLDKGSANQSLANLRKEVRIDLLNEEGQPVWRFFIHRCWVSEYQALPDLDAGANAIAIEHIKLENEGWEHDLSLTEPTEI